MAKPTKLTACLLEMTPLPTDFSQIHTLHFFGIAAPWDFVFMHYKGKFDRHIFLFPPSALANIKLLQHLGHTSKLRDVGSIFITV